MGWLNKLEVLEVGGLERVKRSTYLPKKTLRGQIQCIFYMPYQQPLDKKPHTFLLEHFCVDIK
jgi:hypothetical protein